MSLLEKLSMKVSTMVASVALSLGIRTVNAACTAWFHQPEVPEGMEKFKK